METLQIYGNFGSAIKKIMKEKKVTYEKLESLSKVSRTYLTQILLHRRIPSIEIIEKISKALDIEPILFKEYRVMKIIETLEKFYWSLEQKDIEGLENYLNKIQTDKDPNHRLDRLKGRNKVGFYPDHVINLSTLEDYQSKILKFTYEEFIKINEDDELIHHLNYQAYLKSKEYEEAEKKANDRVAKVREKYSKMKIKSKDKDQIEEDRYRQETLEYCDSIDEGFREWHRKYYGD